MAPPPPKFRDITGERFAHWTVIERRGSRPTSSGSVALWRCRCVCGIEKTLRTDKLRAGRTTSCGCRRGTHRHTADWQRTPTYRSWQNMVARCTQPSNPAFAHYKKRGITLCERWRVFEDFLADMGKRPEGTTIERKNNDGNYEPGNCRWATKRDQANNRVTNKVFVYRGQTLTLKELSRVTGTNYATIRSRLLRNQTKTWTVEEAVETPSIQGRRSDLGI